MNFDCFSHGQISSKIWLCENLEMHIDKESSIFVLGCWYNLTAFMLLTRQVKCKEIIGIDLDHAAITTANKICNTWSIETPKVSNILGNANTFSDYKMNNVIINCSAEHFDSNDWFELVPEDSIVCVQSSNVIDQKYPWLIKQPNPDIETFANRYPMQETYLLDTLKIEYDSFGYDRFMLIGKK